MWQIEAGWNGRCHGPGGSQTQRRVVECELIVVRNQCINRGHCLAKGQIIVICYTWLC